MAAVSAPTGAISPCTDAAIDSIRRRLLPVLTSWPADDMCNVAWRWHGGGRCRVSVRRPLSCELHCNIHVGTYTCMLLQ